VETETAEEAVEDEGHPRHVAHVFQDGDGGEEDEEDRNVDEDGIDRRHHVADESPEKRHLPESGQGKPLFGGHLKSGKPGDDVARQLIALDDGKLVEAIDDAKQQQGPKRR
jgi:hypothetical protein